MADSAQRTVVPHGLVTAIDVFTGPSPYLPRPAIVASIDIARFGGGRPCPLLRAQRELLRAVLLRRCRADEALDLAPESLALLQAEEPQGIAWTVATVCLELQRLNTHIAEGQRILGGPQGGPPRGIAYGYESAVLGRAAAPAACDLVDAVLATDPAAGVPTQLALPESLKTFLELARTAPIGRSGRKIARHAHARGIPWFQVLETTDLIQLGQGRRRRLTRGSTSDGTPQISHWLSSDKLLCSTFLRGLGIPTPHQISVDDAEAAVAAARSIGYPVVVKPLAGFNGRGVTVGVTRDGDMAAAFRNAAALRRGVLVESYVAGDAYRLIVVDGRFASASRFEQASVVGDGHSTIAALVARENARPLRGQGFASGLLPIPTDAFTRDVLAAQGLSFKTVPEAGRTVRLRQTANLSTGGKRIDVTAIVHPDTRRMAEQIGRAVGIDIMGLDFITPDITRSFRDQACAVNEVNTNPGFGYGGPDVGTPEEAVRILDYLFPPGAPTRIPIIHVHGAGEADAVVDDLRQRLSDGFGPVGCASGRGLMVDGLLLDPAPRVGDVFAARALLCNSTVACALLAVPSETVTRHGVGTDLADVAVLTGEGLTHAALVRAITRDTMIVPAASLDILPRSVRQDGERLVAVGDAEAPLRRRVWREPGSGRAMAADGERIVELGAVAGAAGLLSAAAAWALGSAPRRGWA